jgi:hypothetical protein
VSLSTAPKHLPPGLHLDLLLEAIAVEATAQTAMLAGDDGSAREGFQRAADLYRRSWPVAPPRSFGRLIGMMKAAIIAGGGESEAIYARNAIGPRGDSPPSGYALAIAGLALGNDDLARHGAEVMQQGDDRFQRTGRAITAIVDEDRATYSSALRDIVASFEERTAHLTGVPIADTALMLTTLAGARGLDAAVESPLLPGR